LPTGTFCKIVALSVIVNPNDINIGTENGWPERIHMVAIVALFQMVFLKNHRALKILKLMCISILLKNFWRKSVSILCAHFLSF